MTGYNRVYEHKPPFDKLKHEKAPTAIRFRQPQVGRLCQYVREIKDDYVGHITQALLLDLQTVYVSFISPSDLQWCLALRGYQSKGKSKLTVTD